MANGKLWTPREIFDLYGYATRMHQSTAARRLGRTLSSVQTKVRNLGIEWGRGVISLADLAREHDCSAATVIRMVRILYGTDLRAIWCNGSGTGSRYRLTDAQASRLRKMLAGTLARRNAHRVTGRKSGVARRAKRSEARHRLR